MVMACGLSECCFVPSAEAKESEIDSKFSRLLYPSKTTFFQEDQNLKRFEFIKKNTISHGFEYSMAYDLKTNKINRFLISKHQHIPTIEYFKINPTKYRLRIYGAKKSFPLIFGEMYHRGWSVYLKSWEATSSHKQVSFAKQNFPHIQSSISEGTAETESAPTITLDSNYENPNNPMNRLLKDFKSPENPTSITANKNLSKGKPWETWFPGKLNLTCENFSSPNNDCSTTDPEFMEIERGLNSAVVGLPDVFHWKANGYANSWWLDLDLLKKLPPKNGPEVGFYNLGPDGGLDLEIIIEFWPQRLFYLGVIITGIVVFVCLGILFFSWIPFPRAVKG